MDMKSDYFFLPSVSETTLQEIFVETSDSIMIADGRGMICGIGRMLLEGLDAKSEDILGHYLDELVEEGYFDRSLVMECIASGKEISGIVNDRMGRAMFSTAKPIFNRCGTIRYVVTISRSSDVLKKFMEEQALIKQQFAGISSYLRSRQKKDEVVAVSPAMRQVMALCKSFAHSDGTVLIAGESGTGKEVCANYIYRNSLRTEEQFFPINCGAIPQELVESELFGYEKGAFTGADARGKAGFLEIADKGTVFLDEIGELPIHVQPKLLRFLETGEIKRVGGNRIIHADVRVIAATNQDLKRLVAQHKFRDDLYYRLNVLPVYIPPLRKRREDIIPLAQAFLRQFNQKYKKELPLTPDVEEVLTRQPWPGNVRELRNVVERAVITSSFSSSIPPQTQPGAIPPAIDVDASQIRSLDAATKEFEQAYIRTALQATGGNVARAAKLLGCHRTQIYRKMAP